MAAEVFFEDKQWVDEPVRRSRADVYRVIANGEGIGTIKVVGLNYQKMQKGLELAQSLGVAHQEKLQDQDEDLTAVPLDPDAVNRTVDWGLRLQEKWERVVGLAVIVGTIAWASLAGHWGAVETHEQQQPVGMGNGTNHPSAEVVQQLMAFHQYCMDQGLIDQRTVDGVVCVPPLPLGGAGQ